MFFRKKSAFHMLRSVLIGFFSIPCFTQASPTQNLNLYQFKLESLSRFSSVETNSFKGRSSLWIIFQPSCASCAAQLKDLSCLQNEVRTIALGVHGSRNELAKILRPVSFKGDSFLALPELSRNFQIDATPTLLIVNAEGFLQKTILGRTDCGTLRTYFETKTKKEI